MQNESTEKEEFFFYHKAPRNMVGSHIVPLNVLVDVSPEAHATESEKYDKRPELCEKIIEPLHCKWGDVIFLSPIHPQIVHDELQSAGFLGMSGEYYKIPLSDLDQRNAAIMLAENFLPSEKEIIAFSADLIDSHFSEAMREHLMKARKKRELPLVHAKSQQVFYKGRINVDNIEIVDVR